MIILIDAVKPFNKIQCAFIKNLILGMKEDILKSLKGDWKKRKT